MASEMKRVLLRAVGGPTKLISALHYQLTDAGKRWLAERGMSLDFQATQ